MPQLPLAFLARPIAHRALHDVKAGRPENSCAAAEAAIAHGYGIEIDLQLSRDGHPMVFHDYVLDRLTGARGPIRDRTARELSDIGLSGGDEGVPTFADFLRLVGDRAPLLVELKDQDGDMGPDGGALEEAAASLVKNHAGPVALMSFNPHSVERLRRLLPDHAVGLTTSAFVPLAWRPVRRATCERLRGIPDFERIGADFISHEAADLKRPRVQELRGKGVPVLCWTIRSPRQEAAARALADNITFDGYMA